MNKPENISQQHITKNLKLTLEHLPPVAHQSSDKYIPAIFKINSRLHIVALPVELGIYFPELSIWNLEEI